jgi:hypothetical protein
MDIKAANFPQVSADPHAQSDAPYRTAKGKDGKLWLYRDGKFAATAIYKDGGPGSQGMAGRTCRFDLEDGTHYDSIGPWMGGAEQLFAETGVDLRDRYAVRLIMCRRVEYPKNGYYIRPDMLDVVHYEEDFVEGRVERGRELSQEIANKLGEKLYYFIETAGGSSAGWISPKE